MDLIRFALPGWSGTATFATVKATVRFLSEHTGIPALVIAAIVVVVGYRVIERSTRFLIEVAIVTVLLVAASRLGWLRW